MLLTDNLEVFVVKENHANDFRTEYKRNVNPRQPYFAVKDGENYSIAVVFGKDFEITPQTTNPELDIKVSACRIKIDIDGGLAIAQRIFRMPDTEKRPKVQEFSVFDTATFGGIAPCELQFTKIPMNVAGGFEMTRKLLYQTSHIYIEFERGYLDFSENTEHPRPVGDAGLCDPTLFSKEKKRERFRTKFLRSKAPGAASFERGRFVSREDIKQMTINYCSEEQIQTMFQSGNLVRATHSRAQMACIAALDRFVQLRSFARTDTVQVRSTPIKTPVEAVQTKPEAGSNGPRSSGIKPSKSLRIATKDKRSPKNDDSHIATKARKKTEVSKPVSTLKLKEFSKLRQGGGLLQASQRSPGEGSHAERSTPQQSQISKKQKVAETPTSKRTAATVMEKTESPQQKTGTPKSAKRKRIEVDLTLGSDDESSGGEDGVDEEQLPQVKKAKKAHLGFGLRDGGAVSRTYEDLMELQHSVPSKTSAKIETPRLFRAQTEAPIAASWKHARSLKPLETVKPADVRKTAESQKPAEMQKPMEAQKPSEAQESTEAAKQPKVQTSTESKTPRNSREVPSPLSNNLSSTTSSRSKPFDWCEQAALLKRCLSMPPEPAPGPTTQDTRADEKAKRKRTKEEKAARKKAKQDAMATDVSEAIDQAASPEDPKEHEKDLETTALVTPAASVISAQKDDSMVAQPVKTVASTHAPAEPAIAVPADAIQPRTTPSSSVSDGGSAYIRQLSVPQSSLNKACAFAVAGWKNVKDLVDQIENQQQSPKTPAIASAGAKPVTSSRTDTSPHRESSSSNPQPAISVHTLSDSDLKLRIAKHEYKILSAESAGRAESEEVMKKKIEMVKCKIELGKREIERLEEKLAC